MNQFDDLPTTNFRKAHIVIAMISLSLATFILPIMVFSAYHYSGILAPSVELLLMENISIILLFEVLLFLIWIAACIDKDQWTTHTFITGVLSWGSFALIACMFAVPADSFLFWLLGGFTITGYILALIIGVAVIQRMFGSINIILGTKCPTSPKRP